ncbi:MAG: DUF2341 domain-containing protein [Patescibacteria group bacterium]|nr:DUF2341 domain-containing protein [Patescibacteria group bacterium]
MKKVLSCILGLTLVIGILPMNWEVPKAHAAPCEISSSTDITAAYASSCQGIFITGDSTLTFHGEDLDVGGAEDLTLTVNEGVTATWSGSGFFSDSGDAVVINGTVTHAASGSGVVIVASGSVTVGPSGAIDLDGKGCKGGEGNIENGYGPNLSTGICALNTAGYGYADYSSGGGGGYGGLGGRATNVNNGARYGSSIDPVLLGSGGGAGGNGDGGDGGGRAYLDVLGTLTVNGTISADGTVGGLDGTQAAGGGSGGGVYINAATLSGIGTVSAAGGNGVNSSDNTRDGGGGGGGRIAVYYGVLNGFDLGNITAAAGLAGASSTLATDGTNGTTFILDRTSDDGAGNLRVTSGLDFKNGVDYVRTGLVFDDGADFYCEDQTTLNIGTVGNLSFLDGTWDCSSAITTINLTASGTINTSGADWDITNTTNFNLSADTWTTVGASTIDINKSGAVVDWDVANDLTLNNLTWNGNTGVDKEAGTASADGGAITFDNDVAVALVNTDITASVNWEVASLNIDSDSSIAADGVGCAGGGAEDDPGDGPNTTTGVCATSTSGFGAIAAGGGGAGHGGAGGDGTTGSTGGSTYDSNTAPVFMGSGGGASQNTTGQGGDGGGKVILDIDGTLTVAGSITANGEVGTCVANYCGGGGSGGTINIGTSTLAGAGSIDANGGNGGNGSSFDGGGGGGGRVAVYYATDSSSFLADMIAGNTSLKGTKGGTDGSPADGADGTLYKLQYSAPSTPYITAGSGTGSYQNSRTPVLISSTYASDGLSHTTSDWKITTDLAGDTTVWSASDDSSNLESITVNDSKGTFAGVLSGETQLAQFTTYYAFARHTNAVGDSSWSGTGHSFTTLFSGVTSTQVWDFDEASPSTYYVYDDSIVDVDVVDSMASLKDLGGGTYTASFIPVDGNTKRKAVTITNSGAELTDYQVGLTVAYDSDMQADFDDLRFTTSDGSTEIDYWVESYTASTTASVWVEIPTVAASADTTLYMYYGNSSAATESDIDNTFLFADDFDDGTVDSSKWTTTGTFTEADGTLKLGTADGVWSTDYALADDTAVFYRAYAGATENKASLGFVELAHRFEADLGSGEKGFDFGFWTGANCYMERGGVTFEESNFTYNTGWNNYSIEYHEGTSLKFTYPSSTFTETTASSIVQVSDDPHLQISSFDMADFRADYVFVRKAAGTEPTSVFGAEASMSLDDVKIHTAIAGTHPEFSNLFDFDAVYSGNNAGTGYYQISADGSNWFYHSGTSWLAVSDINVDHNTEYEINSYLGGFTGDVGTGSIYVRSFLFSDGTEKVEIDSVSVTYDAGAPSGLAAFLFDSSTATTATFTWTAAADPAFDHYEVWYGTGQSDVQGRTGQALEWDNGNDANLASAATATTTVTGLTAGLNYYAKIWAVDALSNESALDDITFNTNQSPTVSGVSGSQDVAGSSEVTIEFTVDDGDDDNLSAKIEYNVGSGWQKATLLSDVSATYGTPEIDNSAAYQVGTGSAYIITSSGANTVSVIWDTVSDESNIDISTALVRVTPYDTIAEGAAGSSSAFIIDQLNPSGGLSDLNTSSITSSSIGLSWTAVAVESNFYLYRIYYKVQAAATYALAGTLSTMSAVATTLTNLVEGATYNIYVQAVDNYGNSASTPVLTVATINTQNPVFGQTTGGGGGGGSSSSSSGGSDIPDDSGDSTDIVSGHDYDPDELAGEVEVVSEDFEFEEGISIEVIPLENLVIEQIIFINREPVLKLEEKDTREVIFEDRIEITFQDDIVIVAPVSVREDVALEVVLTDVVLPEDKIADQIFEDKDNDGLLDIWEEMMFSDKDFDGSLDTDADGLTDAEEFLYGSDPLNSDTDNDGLSDKVEVLLGIDADSWDSDGDGISDVLELIEGSDPSQRDYVSVDESVHDEDFDSDGDGMSDYMESVYRTDPWSSDSDFDGISDMDELYYGFNPNKADYVENIKTKITNLPNNAVVRGANILIKGTSEPNIRAVVYVLDANGAAVSSFETDTDELGKFIVVVDENLSDGDYNLFVAGVDGKKLIDISAIKSFTVNTDIGAPEIKTPEIDEEGDISLKAFAAPGSIIYVTWRSMIFSSIVVADSLTGEFEVKPPSALSEGEHKVYVYAENPATGIRGDAIQVDFSVGKVNLLYQSAAIREAEGSGGFGTIAVIMIFILIILGVLTLFIKSRMTEEKDMLNKL